MRKTSYYLLVLALLFSSFSVAQDNGLSFDGIDDHVSFVTGPSISGSSTITFEAWINPTTTAGVQTIASWNNGTYSGSSLVKFSLEDGLLVLYEDDSGIQTGSVVGSIAISAGVWTHVAFTMTAGSINFYVNGVEEIEGFNVASPPLCPDMSFAIYAVSFEPYGGLLDEVKIWDIALDQTTIQSQMFTTLTGSETNLIGYYQFNETSGDVLPDITSNSYDGMLLNGSTNTPPADGITDGPLWVASSAIPAPFITTWTTADNLITIPTFGGESYNYDVYWEEIGNPTHNGTLTGIFGDAILDVGNGGDYRIEVSGWFPRIYFNNSGDKAEIITIEQWGDQMWTSMESAFYGCSNLTLNALDSPDLFNSYDLSYMFRGAISLNADLSTWDVSNVELFNGMFRSATSFNGDITTWDVSSAEDMREMFYFASDFNQNIGGWHTENVTNMSRMFAGAAAFNQPINTVAVNGTWITSSVNNMDQMFNSAVAFNQDLGNWDVSNVTFMRNMFANALLFNQNISSWNIGGLSSLRGFFFNASAFNQPVEWDVAGISDFESTFEGATAFNQPLAWDLSGANTVRAMFANTTYNQDITGWQVFTIQNFHSMFRNNTAFNQDLSSWNTMAAGDMRLMFEGATSFNQSLGSWDIGNINSNDMIGMLDGSGLSIENYDNTLIGWFTGSPNSGVNLGASGLKYCGGEVARAGLIALGWNISDAGRGCIVVFAGSSIASPEISNGQLEPIDFGSTPVSTSKTRTFTIQNELAVPITNLDIAFSGSSFIAVSPPLSISVGGIISFDINLFSLAPGVFSETVSITSDNFSVPFTFIITGETTTIPEPEIAVFEGSSTNGKVILDGDTYGYDIGDEYRGTDVSSSITIENKGSAQLDLTSLSVSGSAFSLSQTGASSIAVDGTLIIDITLSGVISGVFSETVTINSNDSNEPSFDFLITGEIYGPEIRVYDGPSRFGYPEVLNGQAAPVDLGSVTEGSNITTPFTFANYGMVDLDISDISITGSAFKISPVAPILIAGEFDGVITTSTHDLTFTGVTPGTFNETITISTNDDANPNFTFDITGSVVAPPHIYWTENIGNVLGDDEIHRTDLEGNDFTQYYSGFSDEISGLAIDTTANRLYWTDAAKARIVYGEIGASGLSSGPTVIYDASPSSTNALVDLALDTSNGHIYFTHGDAENGFSNKIARVNLDGSNLVELIDLGFEKPFGIELDFTNNKIYFTTNILGSGHDARLYRSDLNGTNLEELEYLPSATLNPVFYRDVKIDHVNEIVYWGAGEADLPGTIYSNSINEVAPFTAPTSFTTTGEVRGLDLDPINNKLYWMCRGANAGAIPAAVMRSDFDGSNKEGVFVVTLYPPSYPSVPAGSSFIALDLRGASGAPTCPNPPMASAGADQTICNDNAASLNGTVAGANSQTWTSSGDGTFDNVNSVTAQYTPGASDISNGSVTLTITTEDPDGAGECLAASDDILILIEPEATADAGVDQSICSTTTALLAGSFSGSEAMINWTTSGDGNFDNPSIPNASYTPGANDLSSGQVSLFLTSTPSGACSPVQDELILTITAPIAIVNQTASVDPGSAVTIDMKNGSNINATDIINTTVTSAPTLGVLAINNDGTIVYTANNGTSGTDLFEIQICNQCGACSIAQVSVTINNTPPTINIPPATANPGQPITINVLAGINDPNDNLDLSSLKITAQPLSGAVATIDGDFNLVVDYTGVKFSGTDVLTIEICDFDGQCVTQDITIEVGVPGVVVYNAVSPNGDGMHDFLEIENADFFPNNFVQIMNRWGDVVFEASGYDNSSVKFEGIANKGGNGELPPGTYFYQIDLGDGSKVTSGYFSLRR